MTGATVIDARTTTYIDICNTLRVEPTERRLRLVPDNASLHDRSHQCCVDC